MNEELLKERIIRRQEIANEKILKEIGKVLGQIGELTPSQAYTIAQQLKYGESLDKILKIISETANINQQEIYKMLEKEAIFNLNDKKKYFKANGIDFISYEKNIALQNVLNEIASATLMKYSNISKTTGIKFLDKNGNTVFKPILNAYNELIDDAILNISTGKENFYEGLKNQLQTIGENGIRSIEYETGRTRRIDSAMRMNINDGLNRLAIAQQELVGNQFGANGWEVSVHLNPAPDHEEIQGHIFRNEEFDKLQDYDYFGEIKDINGNVYIRDIAEHIRPIGELNCYHIAKSIVIDVDKPIYSQEELDKIIEENHKPIEYNGRAYTKYECTQIQRRLETELRKTREEKIITKAGNIDGKLNDELAKLNKRESHLLEEYHKITSISGLPTKLERTRVLTGK